MSMRRTALFTAVVVATSLIAVPGSPARADATIVVRGNSFGSELNGVATLTCAAPLSQTSPITVTTPATSSPLGTRALLVTPSSTGTGAGWNTLVDSVDAVTTFTMDVRSTTPNEGRVIVTMPSTTPGESRFFWLGVSEPIAVPGAIGYQTVSGLGHTFAWTKYNFEQEVVDTASSQTLDSFLAGHGGDRQAQLIMVFGCNGAEFTTDRWRVGDVSSVITYDLEGIASSVTATASATKVAPSGPVTLSTTLRVAGELVAGSSVTLQARQPNGSFSNVGTATTNGQGVASLVVRPVRTTTYRWSFAGSTSTEASVSAQVTVRVQPVLTATATKTRFARGGNLVVTGKVSPTLEGATVTLWRTSGVGPVRLATAKVKADGTYRAIRRINEPGRYRVFTSIPAVGTYLPATSPTIGVTVTRQ